MLINRFLFRSDIYVGNPLQDCNSVRVADSGTLVVRLRKIQQLVKIKPIQFKHQPRFVASRTTGRSAITRVKDYIQCAQKLRVFILITVSFYSSTAYTTEAH